MRISRRGLASPGPHLGEHALVKMPPEVRELCRLATFLLSHCFYRYLELVIREMSRSSSVSRAREYDREELRRRLRRTATGARGPTSSRTNLRTSLHLSCSSAEPVERAEIISALESIIEQLRETASSQARRKPVGCARGTTIAPVEAARALRWAQERAAWQREGPWPGV